MNLAEIRLLKEPDKSFIVYHETMPFTPWHYHPEFELVYIVKGRGKRMVGDHIDHFEEEDLVFLGSNLAHEWHCNDMYFEADGHFAGEGIVIQFLYDFLGKDFMLLPENRILKEFLKLSCQGCRIYGNTKAIIIGYMKEITHMNHNDRLYTLLKIFHVLQKTDEYHLLSSPGFIEPFNSNESKPLTRAIEYIMTNFQKEIRIQDLLEVAHMSNTTFCSSFKKAYRMNFKEYLLNVRIGYACRLLQEGSINISEIAYESGYENISNFNRQFKRIKGLTPKEFKQKAMLV